MNCLNFGIIADPQYVDADDGATFDGKTVRRYRHSKAIVESCASYFRDIPLSFAVILGDILDTKAKHLGTEQFCLETIVNSLKDAPFDWHILVGNHDLSCISREGLYDVFIPEPISYKCSPQRMYYDFVDEKSSQFRFVVLDGYDISTISPSDPETKHVAIQMLLSKNKNLMLTEDGNISGGNWFSGLSIHNEKFVPFNGALSAGQLDWFRDILRKSAIMEQKCFVFCHEPCYIGCCRPSGLLWNAEEVLAAMHEFPSTVVAYISGHDHNGGYAVDSCNIHHIVPPAPLECDVGEMSYGYISLFEDHFQLNWIGKEPSPVEYTPWPNGQRILYSDSTFPVFAPASEPTSAPAAYVPQTLSHSPSPAEACESVFYSMDTCS